MMPVVAEWLKKMRDDQLAPLLNCYLVGYLLSNCPEYSLHRRKFGGRADDFEQNPQAHKPEGQGGSWGNANFSGR